MDLTEFEELTPERVDGVGSPANGVGFLMLKSIDDPDEATKFVSAEQRRKDAASGVAMPDGAFPIPDEGHLRSAIGRLAEYKGDKAKAKRHIIARARALHLTHLLPKDWNVSKDAAKQTAPDKSVPEHEAESQTHDVDAGPEAAVPSPDADDGGDPRHVGFPHGALGDGQGDTAPDKTSSPDASLGQTRGLHADQTAKAEIDMTGDKAPEGADEAHEAEDEAEGQTREMGKGSADSDPGSPAWEHKDVALGEKAERLASELAAVVREFTEREKAEGGHASKSARRVLRRIRSLTENPTLLMEAAKHMSASELLKALDESEAARRAEKKAQKEAAARKAAKRDEKAAKAAKAAKKAAKAAGTDKSAELLKMAEAVKKMESQVEKMAARRPFVNGAGVTAVLRGPAADQAWQSFDERVAEAEARLKKASNDYERQSAQAELEAALKSRLGAKLVASDNARERGLLPRGRFGPNSADLFGGSTLSLPEDRALKSI